MFEGILSITLGLIGIICVIVLTYFAGKWYARKMGAISGGNHIKIIDRVVVSKSSSMLIIDVEGKQYLVGAGDNHVSILKEIDQPIVLSDPSLSGDKFKNYLKTYLNRDKKL